MAKSEICRHKLHINTKLTSKNQQGNTKTRINKKQSSLSLELGFKIMESCLCIISPKTQFKIESD